MGFNFDDIFPDCPISETYFSDRDVLKKHYRAAETTYEGVSLEGTKAASLVTAFDTGLVCRCSDQDYFRSK